MKTQKSLFYSVEHAGFSLPESLVTMLILLIFLSIGVPLFLDLVQRDRLRVGTTQIAGALSNIRNSAMSNSVGCQVKIKGKDSLEVFTVQYASSGSVPVLSQNSQCIANQESSSPHLVDVGSLIGSNQAGLSLSPEGPIEFTLTGSLVGSGNKEIGFQHHFLNSKIVFLLHTQLALC